MGEVFLWAVIYLATMLLGYVLKRLGVFKQEDRKFLSDVIFYVTLPAMLVSSFTGVTVDLWFLIAMLLGFGTNALMVGTALFVSRKKSPELQALYVLNGSGLNLGNITMPFLRNFYAAGIPYICMFDIGDSFFTLGTTNAIACTRLGRGVEGSWVKNIVVSLSKSVPFDTYLIMTLLALLHIQLPDAVLTAADFMGRGNGFLAMLLVGLSLEFRLSRKDLGELLGLVAVRYSCAALAALVIWFLIPAPLLMRKVLALSVFSAAPNVALIYSTRLGIRTDIVSALAPVTTLLMIPMMSVLMLLMG